ncbi:MAG: thioredoxin family protein [Anaerolineae bacterium]|nr:thioredoxin family protein [Anaerolineae bacterium]
MTDENPNTIIVYGTQWCGDTIRARRILDNNNIPYEWVDINKNPEAARLVEKLNKGYRSVPTIVFTDGSMLVEPSNNDLMKKLGLA